MAPMYKGENGIDRLNQDLQEVFNPKSKEKIEITYGEVIFRENDKILQLVNMPEENVFNDEHRPADSQFESGSVARIGAPHRRLLDQGLRRDLGYRRLHFTP
jgi:hypothetical protein